MFRAKKYDVWASEIADYLNKPLLGEDFVITNPASIQIPKLLTGTPREKTPKDAKILLLSEQEISGISYSARIPSEKPELDFAYILVEFFATTPVHQIHPTAIVDKDSQIGRNVMIGAYSIIGQEVVIGDNTQIFNNVIINGPVTLGKFCIIKDGAVIGSEGWKFVNNEEGLPVHPPQLGHIQIGDHVWIGANATIERGMIEETRIGTDVKIDDLVHIGAGSEIGDMCELTAGAILGTHVTLGHHTRIAPNAVIRENITIGEQVLVGQGSVVIENLASRGVYVGNPTRFLKTYPGKE